MKAAIYLRVSTNKQEFKAQEGQLLRYAEGRGWKIVRIYAEKISGTKPREQLDAMLREAESRKFEAVLFWSLDRLSREGPLKTMLYLERLSRCGTKFHSLCEPFLDSVSGVGELLVPVLAWLAKQEAVRRGERVRAGIAKARQEGTRSGNAFGRPRRAWTKDLIKQLKEDRKRGFSWRSMSVRYKLPVSSIRRAVVSHQSAAGAIPRKSTRLGVPVLAKKSRAKKH